MELCPYVSTDEKFSCLLAAGFWSVWDAFKKLKVCPSAKHSAAPFDVQHQVRKFRNHKQSQQGVLIQCALHGVS